MPISSKDMISIIIVTMGDDETLRACIKSIREQVRCPYEIVLINNVPEKIRMDKENGLLIIENQRNMGFARAVNKGIDASSGDLILLLNADTKIQTDIVSKMGSFMRAHARAGICGIQLVFDDGSPQNSIDIIPNLLTETLNKSLLKIIFKKQYPSKRSGFTRPVEVPMVIGACMMIKRQVIEAIGALDEGFFFYLEETDLCKRARDHGFEVWHLPGLEITHYQGLSAKKTDLKRKIAFQTSMYTFFMRHKGVFPTICLYLLTLLKLLIEAASDLVLSFVPENRLRLKRSAYLLVWHLTGMPPGWGLEKTSPGYHKKKRCKYTWFLPRDKSIPEGVCDPNSFMQGINSEILNASRTTLVKTAIWNNTGIYIKRYNFKGAKDSIKNLFRKSRAKKAFEAAIMLDGMGIKTAPIVFACEKRVLGLLMDSFIVTEDLQAQNLVQYHEDHPFNDQEVKTLGTYIRRLHERGILHTDLKGENLLMDKDRNIYLIDLDRLGRKSSVNIRTRIKNLSYLNASFYSTVPYRQRQLFFHEYIKGNTCLEKNRESLLTGISAYTKKRLRARYE
ncbi:MAG: lipopolysaccharide kinase InaA family protein [Thermodesulfobacteriota bacterium]|nr:lipopolysaccharide kinase InaA family protein [Thermodesulfobacteriota bacterium]